MFRTSVSAAEEARLGAPSAVPTLNGWLPVLIGLIVLYFPTYSELYKTVWDSPDQGHGPLILIVVLWLFWRSASEFTFGTASWRAVIAGAALFIFGLLCYLAGRVLGILVLDVGSQIPVVAGVLLALGGKTLLKRLWFPIVFLLFLVPVPGFLIDAATASLKQVVSTLAESILYAAGYPIARTGVVLNIGPYQLMVADACSGMHSMYSLSALGALYIYLMKHQSVLRNSLLVLTLIPAAFLANIIRVIALVLITYHLGDEAGQGFMHDLAGMVLFVAALLCIFAVDSVLGFLFRPRSSAH